MQRQAFGLAALAAAAGLLGVMGGSVFAQNKMGRPVKAQGATGAMQGGTYTTADFNFTQNAAQGNVAEMQAAKVAIGNAFTQQYKDYAQRMIDDHTLALERLKGLADGKRITLPNKPNAKDADAIARLSKLNGQNFDVEYKRFLIASHLQAAKVYKKELKSGKDAGLKAYAKNTLTAIAAHLKAARALPAPAMRPTMHKGG